MMEWCVKTTCCCTSLRISNYKKVLWPRPVVLQHVFTQFVVLLLLWMVDAAANTYTENENGQKNDFICANTRN